MNGNENLVIEDITEKVDETTEETAAQAEGTTLPEKVYTEEEFKQKLGEALDKKVPRMEAKIRKEYEDKYGELENVLKAGTGKKNVTEVTDVFKEYYEKRGVQIPPRPAYSDSDIEILARAEAEDIIRSGDDEVTEELNRLADLGTANMSSREKTVFKNLMEHRQKMERNNALSKLGVAEDVYDSKEFKDFAAKFSSNTPATEIYEIYSKMQPKKDIRTMGSMKSGSQTDNGVKEYYTFEEASKFTKEYLDKNPKVYEAVVRSMPKWSTS